MVSIAAAVTLDNRERKFIGVFWLVLSILYVIIATLSYAIMFREYKRSREKTRTKARNGEEDSSHQSTISVFLNSRFYVSVLIVVTYLLFKMIPTLIHNAMSLNYDAGDSGDGAVGNSNIFHVMYYLNYTTDGLIYIFMQKRVRRHLWSHFRWWKDG